ncbi:magnesium-translocating P-type ATPase [Curvibacter gracilis]|uniref:magnesium-translocating P-type ATPase n=1 Tax=Curvibacter gracilis TaxID=230310 RepID=UPI00047F9BE0|nr:magnesium-translocating P-type ATPase [Curvibacter gracilis]
MRALLPRWLAPLLRRRYTNRLFGRHAWLDHSLAHPPEARPSAAGPLVPLLMRAAQATPEQVLAQLQATAGGLSEAEAAERLRRVGPNEVAHDQPPTAGQRLWRAYNNPFNLLLTLLAAVSWLTDDSKATVVIGSMVVLSTVIRFVQEARSSRAAEALKALVSNTATVWRVPAGGAAPQSQERPIRELVPGDHLQLSAGDMIPADCRVLSARDLFVAQAAMTGESMPVEKFVSAHDPHAPPNPQPTEAAPGQGPLEQHNLLFMGTNVVSGSATAVVLATGNQSYFGTVAAHMNAGEGTVTAFQSGVNSVSWLLIRFALVMVPIVLLVNGFTKGHWGEAFLFAMSVAVGLTPEMLPMIVTTTLAKGAVMLSRKQVIVKRLDAIQNFGAMNVLCTDKTGTLTQDRIVLERHTDVFGQASDEVLKFAYLNSHYQTGLKNLLDRAVLEHVEMATELRLAQDYRKVDEIPFDFVRRRMSVVVAEQDHHHELICKGALEEMLAICTRVRTQGPEGESEQPLDGEVLARVHEVAAQLNREGLRVVAVAMKELPLDQTVFGVADESALTLIGYVAFLDPPKESTAPALQALADSGVAVKVLTGDNELVTARVCAQVGLPAQTVVRGPELDALDDTALAACVEQHQLFAKLTPLHKERIVRALRRNGHVVGFMGDGINDAPALRAADIGISVDSAVDIAKEAADIILLEKSLMVLQEGVLEGRRTFCNLLKYLRMTASSNFGNVFSVLVASAFLPFLPMLPLQLLVQNLLYDFSQTAIPFDRVDDELVQKPLRWNPEGIGRFMVYFGPLSSVFDIATFALMWWVFGANSEARQTLFQSGWFVVGLLTQTLIVHLLRSPRLPFVQSRPAPLLLGMTAGVAALGVFLVQGPWAGYFRLQALPPAYFGWLLLILLGYGLLTTAVKRWYAGRFGWQ